MAEATGPERRLAGAGQGNLEEWPQILQAASAQPHRDLAGGHPVPAADRRLRERGEIEGASPRCLPPWRT